MAAMAKADDIATELEEQILDGTLPPGSVLPRLSDLAHDYSASRSTVVAAMELLEQWGHVDRDRGLRAQVRNPTRMINRYKVDEYIDGYRNGASAQGVAERAGSTKQAFEIIPVINTIPASAELAQAFSVAVNEPLLEQVFTWDSIATGQPSLQLTTSFMLKSMTDKNPAIAGSQQAWDGGTTEQLRSLGIKIGDVVDHIIARMPYRHEVNQLDIKAGVPVLAVRRITEEEVTGRVVEVLDSVHPGHTTQFIYRIPLSKLTETEGTP